jgi:hypothetical protein
MKKVFSESPVLPINILQEVFGAVAYSTPPGVENRLPFTVADRCFFRRNRMAELVPGESEKCELSDEETFRQAVEGFAQVRPGDKQRRIPRFPTPGALSARLGAHGFEGNLILEDFDLNDDVTGEWEENESKGNGKDKIVGINIVDFCEAGIQLQFQCDDFLRLKESLLYLELQNQRFPVTLVWFQKSGSVSRGGFSFNTEIHSDLYLARIVSTLNAELVDFLVSSFRKNPAVFTVQAGVFAYLSIYYGLRLRFMEALAKANTAETRIEPGSPFQLSSAFQDACRTPYTNTYNMEQISKCKSDPKIRKLLYQYLRPYYQFGCGIVGQGHKAIFLKEDALATIFNSVLIAVEDCRYAPAVLPSLSFLYQSFLYLKQLLPGILGEAEFDAQFRYYSSIIYRVQRTAETLLTFPAMFQEDADHFEPREQEA